jgi:hypothetical protein
LCRTFETQDENAEQESHQLESELPAIAEDAQDKMVDELLEDGSSQDYYPSALPGDRSRVLLCIYTTILGSSGANVNRMTEENQREGTR